MGKIERGRFTLSTNVILTASLITRTLTFGFVMLCIYIKVGDEILDADVIRIANLVEVLGRPFGSTIHSLVFSMIGVFLLEFITGTFATWGAIAKKKMLLVVATMLSALMLVVYTVYIVVIAIIYHKRSSIYEVFRNYMNAYGSGSTFISSYYLQDVVPGFLYKLGCSNDRYSCYSVYRDQVVTYLQAYFGVITTCMVCHCVSIVAIEYTYRKLEFKEEHHSISRNKYYLLLTIRHGIGRNILQSIKETWNRSKLFFATVVGDIVILIVGLCLLGLGLTLCGDDYITNGALKHIFYRLQFHEYYFYDILVGLAASSVVLGVLTSTTAVIGLVGLWRKSTRLITTNCLLSSIFIVLYFLSMVINAVFTEEINDKMTHELRKLQDGYYYISIQNAITTSWNEMIVLLNCCGVKSYTDTFSPDSRDYRFCCVGTHGSNMDYSGAYSSADRNLLYFGGCPYYRTTTCAWRILYKTRVYMSLFIAATVLLIVLQVIGIILTNISFTRFIDKKSLTSSEDSSTERPSILRSCTQIYRNMGIKFKELFIRYSTRKVETIIYSILLGTILVLSLCLLGFAIHIRYDAIFGNDDIREVIIDFISVSETRMDDAIKYFSIVLTTFSSCAIMGVAYSYLIMVPGQQRRILSILCIVIWIVFVVANIVQLGLWGKYFAEVTSSISEQLPALINQYSYSHISGYHYYGFWSDHRVSLSWNTIFVKGKCCGLGSDIVSSFVDSAWFSGERDSAGGQVFPVQCCKTETDVYPFESRSNSGCTHTPSNYHTEGCDSVIEKRLKIYSIPFFVLTSIIIIAEICVVGLVFLRLRTKQSSDREENLIESKSENDDETEENGKENNDDDETEENGKENNDEDDTKNVKDQREQKRKSEREPKKDSDAKTQLVRDEIRNISKDRRKSQASNMAENLDISSDKNVRARPKSNKPDDKITESKDRGLSKDTKTVDNVTETNEQDVPNENDNEAGVQTGRSVSNNDLGDNDKSKTDNVNNDSTQTIVDEDGLETHEA